MDEDWNDSRAASDAPLPPPPPPPPPPQVHPEDELEMEMKQKKRPMQQLSQAQKPKKKKDFREILALFHDESMDADKTKRVWTSLWQTMLVESQEDHKKRRQQEQRGFKRKKNGDHDHGPMSTRGGLGALSRPGNSTQEYLKRARQVWPSGFARSKQAYDQILTWICVLQSSMASTDSSESGKPNRLGGRFPKNVSKGSKLLQKFGGRA